MRPATLKVQVEPGQGAHVTGYEDQVEQLMAVAPGSLVDAILRPMQIRGRLSESRFKLITLTKVTPPAKPVTAPATTPASQPDAA